MAFSTAASERRETPPVRVDRPTVPDAHLDPLFAAVVEATEEAVLNALWAAVDTTGRSGRIVRALPHEPVLELLRTQRPAGLTILGLLRASRSGRSPTRARPRRRPEITKPTNESRCRPIDVRAVLREHADDRRADEAAEDDQRHRDPVDGMVDVVA